MRFDPRSFEFEGLDPPRTRPIAADGTPLEPAFALSDLTTGSVATAQLPSGSFVNAWASEIAPIGTNQVRSFANVVSLCTPAIRSCGDGVVDGRCEECDDGAGNDDAAADACRTTCVLPSCGDGASDTGEACDDGNTESCDGCSMLCEPEVGIGCGDGMTVPGCAERCDDGNAIAGDGCTPACVLERVPGGGSRAGDCVAEWVVNNPANVPRFDTRGDFSAKQHCVDGDPRCDFGAVVGSCTFRIRVCANNTDVAGCTAPTRLASWQLAKPSTKQAAKRPELATVRAAFAGVAGAIVGPSLPDVCSADIEVIVPLRGVASNWRPGSMKLKGTATTYDGRKDNDGLALTCDPPTS
jgi:cysteine-rich repeat protein